MRQSDPSLWSRILSECDRALRVLAAPAQSQSPNPARGQADLIANDVERRHAAGLMRINHAGEVCAQALYFGHAAASRSAAVRAHLLHAAAEEGDHLAWCEVRLRELDARPSAFNAAWYAGAWAIGYASARVGDRWGLGFVVETERQVEAHLHQHLSQLPSGDQRSRAIVTRMRDDERRHGEEALKAGGHPLPWPIPNLMKHAANVLRAIAYRI
jgi:ubiquinone biosynthesis monooxygenase Coq7